MGTTWPLLDLRPSTSSCNPQGPSRSDVHTHVPAAVLSVHTVTQTQSRELGPSSVDPPRTLLRGHCAPSCPVKPALLPQPRHDFQSSLWPASLDPETQCYHRGD